MDQIPTDRVNRRLDLRVDPLAVDLLPLDARFEVVPDHGDGQLGDERQQERAPGRALRPYPQRLEHMVSTKKST